MDTSTPKYYSKSVRDAIYRYRETHHEQILEIAKKANSKWYEANKEKRKESMKNYIRRKKLESSKST